jgi:hypothetical protein
MLRRLSKGGVASDAGTVTAELAIAMPTVALVIAVALSGFGLQVERMKFVAVAASAARALGRGETPAEAQVMLAEIAPEAEFEIDYSENHICATVSKKISMLGLQDFEISERQCARKMGL